MRRCLTAAIACLAILVGSQSAHAQGWSIGGNMGLSLLAGTPGFHITPSAELLVNRRIGIGSEFSLNTQYGAPLIWHPYFKHYFGIRGSEWRPYASAGPLMAFNVPNGPCFGFLLGGGMNVPVAHRLYLSPNFLIGPVFGFGGGVLPLFLRGYYWGIETYGLTYTTIPSATILAFTVRAGLRYEI